MTNTYIPFLCNSHCCNYFTYISSFSFHNNSIVLALLLPLLYGWGNGGTKRSNNLLDTQLRSNFNMANVVPESWRVSPFTSSLWHCHLQGVTCPGSHSYSMPMLHSPIAISLVFPLASSFCWLLSLGQYLYFHDLIIISLIRILNSLSCTLSLIREFPLVSYYAIEAVLSKPWFNLKPQSLILKSVSPFISSFPSDLSCTKTKSPVSLLEFTPVLTDFSFSDFHLLPPSHFCQYWL